MDPVGAVSKKKRPAPIELSIELTGDQRATENVILEVRAIARQFGLEIPSVKVVRQPLMAPKVVKRTLRGRKAR
jgi:NifB/MoaA-like Fe-S oxidoreductase